MDGLHVVTIEALPSVGSGAFGQYGGAFVSVYTAESSEQAALTLAQREIADAGWSSKAVEKVAYVTRDDFHGDDVGLSHFNQAIVDGVVLVSTRILSTRTTTMSFTRPMPSNTSLERGRDG